MINREFVSERCYIENIIPNEILMYLSRNKGYIAGGAIRSVFSGEKISDFDLYFEDEDCFTFFENWVRNGFEFCSGKNLNIISESFNALTFECEGYNYQIIRREDVIGLSPDQLFEVFDFTICMGAYIPDTGKFMLHEDFLRHTSQRKLVYTSSPYPISSMHRTKKYIDRGYSINGIEIMKISLDIADLNLNTMEDVADQFQGIDVLVLKSFIEELKRNKDEEYSKEKVLKTMENYLPFIE